MAGGREFKAKLGSWGNATAAKLDGLARQSSQEMAYRVVLDTPVDTGFLRSSWQPALGNPKPSQGKEFGLAGSGAQAAASLAFASIGVTISDMKAGDRFHFTNGASYANFIEFGTTRMAGRFMVTDNAKRWNQIVSKVAKELGIK